MLVCLEFDLRNSVAKLLLEAKKADLLESELPSWTEISEITKSDPEIPGSKKEIDESIAFASRIKKHEVLKAPYREFTFATGKYFAWKHPGKAILAFVGFSLILAAYYGLHALKSKNSAKEADFCAKSIFSKLSGYGVRIA